MTVQMIIALAITALMIVLIMMDRLPFGAPPLLACLLNLWQLLQRCKRQTLLLCLKNQCLEWLKKAVLNLIC